MSWWAERWTRWSARERVGLAALAVTGVLGWSYLVIYRPQRMTISKSRVEWQMLNRQIAATRAGLPDLGKERRQLETSQGELEQMRHEVERQEALFPSVGALRALLGKVSQEAEGLQVAFDAIEQHVQEDPDHPTVTIDVALKAPYEDLVNYLRRLERITPFLTVARLEMAQTKDDPKTTGAVKLRLIVPLTTAQQSETLPAASETPRPEKVSVPKSPLVSRQRPDEAATRKDLKVTGITWRGESSTAIVNNEVVRVGDRVDHLMVKQILPNQVIFTDGIESYTIPLKA